MLGDCGPAIAAVVFSNPSARGFTESDSVWELSRLVRHEGPCPPLTGLIAEASRQAKQAGAHLLVSFADAEQGHHGGVYRACSWNYAGMRDPRLDGFNVNGRFVPARTANALWGTSSPEKLAKKGLQAEAHFDEGKHLYWRALTKQGRVLADRFGLKHIGWEKVTTWIR